MSNWSTVAASANAAQLRSFGEEFTLQPAGDLPAAFTGVRVRRPSEEGAGAFESIWTRASILPAPPKPGATVLIGADKYVVHQVKEDEDPASDGITLHLNRAKPTLNA